MIPGARYVHTNLIARDWRALAGFYERVFGCTPVPPPRDYAGPALDAGTGRSGVRLEGLHLRLPGHGDDGPTLEIFTYDRLADAPAPAAHRPGFGHVAFAVDSVADARARVLAAGGGAVGEVVDLETSTGGRVTWCYVTDPEGNIVELQTWAEVPPLEVRARAAQDDHWVPAAIADVWGEPFVVSRGRGHAPAELPGLVAERGGEAVGFLSYRLDGDELEVVTLQAMVPRCGAGRVLLAEARRIAASQGCRRAWLVTTNDNAPAIAFYLAVGLRLVALHRGAVRDARAIKPGIPLRGVNDVPIEDELEFEL